MVVDFAQGTTITLPNDIPAGITAKGILIDYVYNGRMFPDGSIRSPMTTFTVSTPMVAGHPWVTAGFASAGGTTITVPTEQLFPKAGVTPLEHGFKYTGNEYKYEHRFTGVLQYATGGFIIPWAGYTTPASSGITFNVNWDLNGIIRQYGTGASATFVLENNFWERFSMTVE